MLTPIKLAEEISKEALKKSIDVDILIEVNIAREESKYGVLPEDVLELVDQIRRLNNVKIKGLMTVAPYTDDSKNKPSIFCSAQGFIC